MKSWVFADLSLSFSKDVDGEKNNQTEDGEQPWVFSPIENFLYSLSSVYDTFFSEGNFFLFIHYLLRISVKWLFFWTCYCLFSYAIMKIFHQANAGFCNCFRLPSFFLTVFQFDRLVASNGWYETEPRLLQLVFTGFSD